MVRGADGPQEDPRDDLGGKAVLFHFLGCNITVALEVVVSEDEEWVTLALALVGEWGGG